MSFQLVVAPSAERDIRDADAYFAHSGRAEEFLVAIDHVFERLEDRPLIYPVVYDVVRRGLIRRFSFAVFFLVEGDRVVVLAVHHQRRDPAARPTP